MIISQHTHILMIDSVLEESMCIEIFSMSCVSNQSNFFLVVANLEMTNCHLSSMS